jgi:hypothetical protein
MVLGKVNPIGPGDKKRAYAAFWAEMMPHVVHSVEASFFEANMRNPTHAEVKHRVELAKKLVDECRNDLKWSKQEIIARLPALLRSKLVGTKDPRDERQREMTKDGISTKVYGVDPVAAAAEKQLVPSEITTQKFEKELPEQDMAGEDPNDEPVIETADPNDPDDVDPTPES